MSVPSYHTVMQDLIGHTIIDIEEHKTYAILTLLEMGEDTAPKKVKIYAGGHGYPNRLYSQWHSGCDFKPNKPKYKDNRKYGETYPCPKCGQMVRAGYPHDEEFK